MNIFMIASEASPFYKTGGLADVTYSLSRQYVSTGHNVSVVIPFYKRNGNQNLINVKKVCTEKVSIKNELVECNFYKMDSEKIHYYFVEADKYFDRDSMYGCFDDGERFACFANAVCQFLSNSKEKVDVVHVHDWQTAMISCLLEIKYKNDKKLKNVKTVLTIHNPMFKGYFYSDSLEEFYGLPYYLFENGQVRLDNLVSTLKAGIVFSDKITTVSPNHAEELTTEEGGFGFNYDLTLRRNDFVGILNGISPEFDPETDGMIYKNYSSKNYKTGKLKNKEELLKEFGHGESADKPLFACITRLSDQKGLDLINSMAGFITRSDAIVAVLGSGDSGEEEYLNELSVEFPYNTIIYIGYSEQLAHKLYAASDFLLMPSKFEPCGLSQMIAQKYGSLPIVRRTGGLVDSVSCYYDEEKNEKKANGFGFDEYSAYAACKCTKFALSCYSDKKLIDTLIKNAMSVDSSWEKSAKEYIKLYESIKK